MPARTCAEWIPENLGIDLERNSSIIVNGNDCLFQLPEGTRLPLFIFSPKSGPRKYAQSAKALVGMYGQPGAVYFLFDRADSVAEINRLGAIRTAMNDGSIQPEDLAELDRMEQERRSEIQERLAFMVDRFLEHSDEPVVVRGDWGQVFRFVNALRERGVTSGLPDGSIVWAGGGQKADVLPDDFEEQIRIFFRGARFVSTFSMSEILPWFNMCHEGRWHAPAQVLPTILDETGEQVVKPEDGKLEGRLGLFDFSLEGRWGGTITGDFVRADLGPCPCGLASTSLLTIGRIASVGDDKLSCAGTIEAYVRGIIQT